jgi:hypothetical protein
MPNQKTILIVAANPSNETRLRLDVEARDIDEGLRLAKHRAQFELKHQWATRVRDLRRAMQEHEPTIVHFCGHGSGEQGIVLENNDGKNQLVSTEALANFFELYADKVECVVLNACFSKIQAQAIIRHIPYVIGMAESIGDNAAIEFAVAFYDSLAAGKGYETAYKFGCNAIEMAGISGHLIPLIFKKVESVPPKIEHLEMDAISSLDALPMESLSSVVAVNEQSHEIVAGTLIPSKTITGLDEPVVRFQALMRRIFGSEITYSSPSSDELERLGEHLFAPIPKAEIKEHCIMLLRTARVMIRIQRITHPNANETDWINTQRLLEATSNVLAKLDYDLLKLDKYATGALEICREKRFFQFQDKDEWLPGMASGSGWIEKLSLSLIGELFLSNMDPKDVFQAERSLQPRS